MRVQPERHDDESGTGEATAERASILLDGHPQRLGAGEGLRAQLELTAELHADDSACGQFVVAGRLGGLGCGDRPVELGRIEDEPLGLRADPHLVRAPQRVPDGLLRRIVRQGLAAGGHSRRPRYCRSIMQYLTVAEMRTDEPAAEAGSGADGQAEGAALHLRRIGPGLAVAAACAAASQLIGLHVAALSALVVAVFLGALVANVGQHRTALAPGAALVAHHGLRIGIVLLGFRLSLTDATEIGATGFVLVVGVVTVTFVAVVALGRLLGLSPGLTSLTATGYAICGVSAIAAMKGLVDADEEEASYAMALVTLCGTLAIVALPLLAGPLDLDSEGFGAWVGASVHDVGQVIATASTNGTQALQAATVVKLTRVALLGPLVAGMGIARRRARRTHPGDRVPLVPWFVIAFSAAIALRATGIIPEPALEVIRTGEVLLFVLALAGLGMCVHADQLRALGTRPLLFGLAAWLVIGAASYAGLRLLTP
ncbi:MAG: putative sulfate exporter family transporter [Acidimicrobiales bacterium]|nr:putative sulfate exporter family transporter [Acidimicrobiales bacterium]